MAYVITMHVSATEHGPYCLVARWGTPEGEAILAKGDTLRDLRIAVKAAIGAYFKGRRMERPSGVRLHFRRGTYARLE